MGKFLDHIWDNFDIPRINNIENVELGYLSENHFLAGHVIHIFDSVPA